MIDVKQIEDQIIGQEKNLNDEDHSLAYMLLLEIKASARRWFIIAMVELFIILAIVGGMIWYNSLPAEEYTSISQDTDGNANQVVGIGDSNYGDTTKSSDIQTSQNDIPSK